MRINNVLVIGATGAVGKTVSGIFASFGNAKVYMIGRDREKLEKIRKETALSVKSLSVMDNLISGTMDDIEEFAKIADFVFESSPENLEIKKQIHKRLNLSVRDDCILSSGTSGLSINELADCYDENKRKNFFGVHFFNPPYSMTLCELIPSRYNDSSDLLFEMKEYLTKKLFRDTVVVKDGPAFLANRIGFMFMNEALQCAEKYKDLGGIDFIDAVLGKYTGRNMSPLRTVDFVGLDVHKAIVDNVYCKSNLGDNESFVLPKFFNELVESGKLGMKTEEGLYKVENDKKLVYDIATEEYREVINYNFYYTDLVVNKFKKAEYKEGFEIIKNDSSIESRICMTFLLKYIIYSIQISKSISENLNDCDNAMASGFNWLPPLALVDVLGGNMEVNELCKKYLNEDYYELLKDIPKSKFDYRKFIKAKV